VADAACFLDSNILVYLLSADASRANVAEHLLKAGSQLIISVQVLNEVTHVLRRKIGLSWSEMDVFWEPVRKVCKIVPLTEPLHDHARVIGARYGFSFYDACIVAAALDSDCRILYSEDMQNGQVVEDTLIICNPFSKAAGII